LKRWEAFDAVEPIGERWLQTAQITTMVERVLEQNALHRGFDKFKPATIESNMPSRYMREQVTPSNEKQKKPMQPNIQFHQVAAAFGLSEVVLKHGRID
jgi:hypothetical protein